MQHLAWFVRLFNNSLNVQTMNFKKYIYLLFIICTFPVFSSCGDDEKIVFTRNMIINDIITDKEVPVVDNDIILNVFTGEEINIHGETGKCFVQTEDTTIAHAVIYDYNQQKSLVIYPHKEGKTSIVVTDSRGNYSTLHLTVKPAEQTRVNSQCGFIVQTENKEDSVKITETLSQWQSREYLINFIWKSQKSGIASISASNRKEIFKGTFSLFQRKTDEGLQASLILYNPKSNLVYATYDQDLQHPNCYIKDLTPQFRAQYKGVKKVQLLLQLNEVH